LYFDSLVKHSFPHCIMLLGVAFSIAVTCASLECIAWLLAHITGSL
jgi:hypothetical protein